MNLHEAQKARYSAGMFSVEQFRNYILSQDSLGDVLYNLSAKNIEKANVKDEDGDEESFVDDHDYNND